MAPATTAITAGRPLTGTTAPQLPIGDTGTRTDTDTPLPTRTAITRTTLGITLPRAAGENRPLIRKSQPRGVTGPHAQWRFWLGLIGRHSE